MNKDVIEVKNLSFSYDKDYILKDLSMTVKEGSFTLLLGRNGAGKTTLIRLILDELKQNQGEIRLFDDLVKDDNHYRDLAYISQSSVASYRNFPTTVSELLKNHLKFLKKKMDIGEILKEFDLENEIGSALSELSGGQIQRLSLILAIIKDAKLLILDEPTAAIDKAFAKDFYTYLKNMAQNGKTILMISHDYRLASKFSDKIYSIQDGKAIEVEREMLKEVLGEFYV